LKESIHFLEECKAFFRKANSTTSEQQKPGHEAKEPARCVRGDFLQVQVAMLVAAAAHGGDGGLSLPLLDLGRRRWSDAAVTAPPGTGCAAG
jgi:hypothetical protein